MSDESIFAEALEIPDLAERDEFLDQACSGNVELRKEIDALLEAHQAENPLDHPPEYQVATELKNELSSLTEMGTIVADRYKLLEQIGEGGMGTVWVAEQFEPVRRKVALKLIKAGMDSKSVLARFEAERQALAMMDHPHIAKVLDGGLTESGRPYFVMEYVKGIPITEYCDTARLSVQERLNLFLQVCSAVQHAHQKGIIHRDLKPSNVLVAPYDDKPVPKVIDFGLAKAMNQSLTDKTLHTAHEMVLGTPLYMSPEQAQLNNLDVDTRTDIYALGVLLYELLTGTTPFEKDSFKTAAWDEVRRIIREVDPPRPSLRLSSTQTLPTVAACRHTEPVKLTQQIRGDLDWIVMKAMEKDRQRRYETANGLARDLERYLADEVIEARPPSSSYKLLKYYRRNRGQVIGGGLLLVTLLFGIFGTTFGLIRAETEREKALVQAGIARENQQEAEENLKLAEEKTKEVINERKQTQEMLVKLLEVFDEFVSPEMMAMMSAQEVLPPEQEASLDKLIADYRELIEKEDATLNDRQQFMSAAKRVANLYRTIGNLSKSIDYFEVVRDEYQRWFEEFPDTLPVDRMRYVNLLITLADVYQANNQFDEALKSVTEAKKIYDQFPSSPLAELHQPSRRRVYQILATIWSHLGDHERAIQYQQIGIDRHEEALADYKDSLLPPKMYERLQLSYASYLYNMGWLKERYGDYSEWSQWTEKAIDQIRILVESHPESDNYQSELAFYLQNYTFVLLSNCRLDQIKGNLEKSIQIYESLARKHSNNRHYQKHLAQSYDLLADFWLKTGDHERALEPSQAALEILEPLHKYQSQNIEFKEFLGKAYVTRARILETKAHKDSALTARRNYTRAVGLFEENFNSNPQAVDAQQSLVYAYCWRARHYQAQGDLALAADDWETALVVCPEFLLPFFEVESITNQLKRGELSLEEALEKIRRKESTDPGAFDLVVARFYLVAGEIDEKNAKEYQDQAVRTLETALDSGKTRMHNIQLIQEFDILKDREDYQQVLKRLGF